MTLFEGLIKKGNLFSQTEPKKIETFFIRITAVLDCFAIVERSKVLVFYQKAR